MLNVLASGTLVADPKQRTRANGKPYATGSMRVPSEDAEAALVSLIAFSSSAVEALLALTKGDPLAVVGRGKLSSWTGRDGTEVRGLNVVVDQVLTIYQVDKRRTRATEEEPA